MPALRSLQRTLKLIVFGGSPKPRPHENRLLDLAATVLPATEREVLQAQREKLSRLQRFNKGRMVMFRFDGKTAPLFPDTGEAVTLASFKKKNKPIGALVIHRGLLSSLELKVPPVKIGEEDWQDMTATYRGKNPGVAETLDRAEHGKVQGGV